MEFAGEGLRRADILRWKTADGKMVAEKVLNGYLERRVRTVEEGDVPEQCATMRTKASGKEVVLEKRVFKPYHRYFPIG